MKKKLWSMLLALCMVLSLLPLSAFAAESDSAAAGGLLRQPEPEASIVYRDEDESASGPSVRKLQASAASSVCTTIEECGAALREGIKQRQNSISFTYVNDAGLTRETLDAMRQAAFAHTGVPTEGDYIRWQVGESEISTSSSDGVNYDVTFYFNSFHDTLAQEQETDAAVAQIVSSLQGKSDYEILKWIYDYLGENVTYDYDAAETPQNQITDHTPWTAYGALVKHKAVCQGYALAFYRLALEMGIDARIVTGTGNGGDHAWIAAKLEGRYYFIDATWGGENNFLKGTETFENHYPDSESDAFLAEMTLSPTDYVAPTVVASGTCGDNVTWRLLSTGVMYIEGEGAMKNYGNEFGVPWRSQRENIKQLIISPGVTSIGNYAFISCTSLSEITIPEGVTKLGEQAFDYCISATSISLPASLTEMGSAAIFYCSGLQEIHVSPDNPRYYDIDGILFDRQNQSIVQYPMSRSGAYTIPDGIRAIEREAFWYCPGLTGITIPDGVESIGIGAFQGCEGLEYASIPDSVQEIGGGAFDGCCKLKSVHIPYGVTIIQDAAFQFCSTLTEIKIPETVTTIKQCAFQGCSGLVDVTIPDSVVSLENAAFDGCENLCSVKLSNNLKEIGYAMFSACSNLESVSIPDGVASIGEAAFSGCGNMKNILIPSTVTSIDVWAFANCDNLTDVYYTGSQAQWNSIEIGSDNNPLTDATIHYNYSGPAITQQPVDYTGALDSTARFTIAAEGEGLTYQWQISTNGGKSWSRSSVTSAVYAAKLTAEKDGRMVRCVVTDRFGNSVTTEPAAMYVAKEITITQQPRDYYGELNSQAVFTVAATGTGTLHYQWQVSTNDGETWSRSSVTTPRYSAKLTLEKDNRMVRCVISDDYGNSITSDPGVMYLEKQVTITQQPEDYIGALNSTARFTVAAEGYGTLSYQWYISTNGGETWSKSSVTSARYAAKLTEEKDGRMVRCVITDDYGNSVTSDPASMHFTKLVIITQQPVDYSGAENSTARFTVVAEGYGPLHYQWQISTNGGRTWSKSSVTSSVYAAKLTAEKDGRLVMCTVTDDYGNSAVTDTAAMHIVSPLTVTQQPVDYTGALDSQATFTVAATGTGTLHYQWEISTNGGRTWSKSSVTSAKYSAKLTEAKDGRMVRCIITDDTGSVTTESAAMHVAKQLAITQQPVNYVGALNSTARFTVVAVGDGLSYQWQVSTNGGKTWSKSSVTSAVYAAKLTAEKDGRLVRCIVMDQNGKSVTSNAVSMKIG